jgi:hypothetical protein
MIQSFLFLLSPEENTVGRSMKEHLHVNKLLIIGEVIRHLKKHLSTYSNSLCIASIPHLPLVLGSSLLPHLKYPSLDLSPLHLNADSAVPQDE